MDTADMEEEVVMDELLRTFLFHLIFTVSLPRQG